MSDYPEHNKLTAQRARHEAAQDFIDFLLDELGYSLMTYERIEYPPIVAGMPPRVREEWVPVQTRRATLIAKFLDIDEDKLEEEKRQMLESLR